MLGVKLTPSLPYLNAITLDERGIIDQLMVLCPPPKSMNESMQKNRMALMTSNISCCFSGRRYNYTSLFKLKEDKDLIFQNSPYFRGLRGMYLNKWTHHGH